MIDIEPCKNPCRSIEFAKIGETDRWSGYTDLNGENGAIVHGTVVPRLEREDIGKIIVVISTSNGHQILCL